MAERAGAGRGSTCPKGGVAEGSRPNRPARPSALPVPDVPAVQGRDPHVAAARRGRASGSAGEGERLRARRADHPSSRRSVQRAQARSRSTNHLPFSSVANSAAATAAAATAVTTTAGAAATDRYGRERAVGGRVHQTSRPGVDVPFFHVWPLRHGGTGATAAASTSWLAAAAVRIDRRGEGASPLAVPVHSRWR